MRLFHKIRRNSLNLGKIKSYLVYAFGEVILISIGVLIAWKINNINEIYKSKAVELKIYTTLNEELDSNLKVIDTAIAKYTEDIEKIQRTLNYISISSNKLSQGAKDTIINTHFRTTNFLDGAISSVVNTKFDLLESDLLKNLLIAYPNDIESFKIQESIIKNIVTNRIQPVLEKHLSLTDILVMQNTKYNKIKTVGEKSNYQKLLKSREYQNSIIDRLVQSEKLLDIANNLRKKTLVISINLNQELS